jgi:Holliday junction resolvase
MTNYSRGAHFERVCKKYLEGAGWFVVRAAQSRGLADLMGARKTEWGYP